MPGFIISGEHLDAVLAHCRGLMPNEACGLLGGRDGRVEMLLPLANTDPSPVSYRMDPSEQLRAIREIEAAGMDLVCIYHSHPASPAEPSPTDIDRAFFPGATGATREPNFPGALYMIIGLSGVEPDVRAFRIAHDGVREVEIVVGR